MAIDREVIPRALESVNKWERPGDLFEHLDETAGFLYENLGCEHHEWHVLGRGTWSTGNIKSVNKSVSKLHDFTEDPSAALGDANDTLL